MNKRQAIFDQINLTPLTDVFLVLLVVLILLTPTMDQSVLKLGSSGNGHCYGQDKSTEILVDIDEDGHIKLDGQEMRFTDSLYLQKELNKIKEKSSKKICAVLVRSNIFTRHKDVVAVMDAAAGAGIDHVGIEPPSQTETQKKQDARKSR